MTDATVRAKYCGASSASSLRAAIETDVLDGGRAVSELAHANFIFECTSCSNLRQTCPAVVANLTSSGSVIALLPGALDRAVARRLVSPAEFKLVLVALARQAVPMLFQTMARYPLSGAPLFAGISDELTHADMTVGSQMDLIVSGVCDRATAARFLQPVGGNQDPDVVLAAQAWAVQAWAKWVARKSDTLPPVWQHLVAAALAHATPLPQEICGLVTSAFTA